MDIFRYYNRKDCKDVNCEPHVDPGLITVIPVSATPGLSVWHPGREEWWPVEQLVQSENEGCKRPRPGSAVIDGAVPEGDSGPVAVAIVGEALGLFTAGLLPASLHRVDRDALRRERFSLVFDLQIPSDTMGNLKQLAQELQDSWVRREAQPPLNVMQLAAGRAAMLRLRP